MSKVYLVQDIPVDRESGQPKYNVMGAQKYGDITVMLPAKAQMIFSPGPLIFQIRDKLKNFTYSLYHIRTMPDESKSIIGWIANPPGMELCGI